VSFIKNDRRKKNIFFKQISGLDIGSEKKTLLFKIIKTFCQQTKLLMFILEIPQRLEIYESSFYG
jgi:hypothetical protein